MSTAIPEAAGIMTDLVAFLRARLDEDEAVARDATTDCGMSAEWNEPTSGCLDVGLPDHGGEDWQDYVWPQGDSRVTRFIARHDPARVLREVEANRAILARYEFISQAATVNTGREKVTVEKIAATLERDVRDIAAVWSDHPDYEEAWNLQIPQSTASCEDR